MYLSKCFSYSLIPCYWIGVDKNLAVIHWSEVLEMLVLVWPEVSDLWQVTLPLWPWFHYLQNDELQRMMLSLLPYYVVFYISIKFNSEKVFANENINTIPSKHRAYTQRKHLIILKDWQSTKKKIIHNSINITKSSVFSLSNSSV